MYINRGVISVKTFKIGTVSLDGINSELFDKDKQLFSDQKVEKTKIVSEQKADTNQNLNTNMGNEYNFYYEKDENVKICDVGDLYVENNGKILELSMTLKSVCPDKSVALGIVLCKVNDDKSTSVQAVKTFIVPAVHGDKSEDIVVKGITFVIPCDEKCIDCRQHFTVRIEKHYVGITKEECKVSGGHTVCCKE